MKQSYQDQQLNVDAVDDLHVEITSNGVYTVLYIHTGDGQTIFRGKTLNVEVEDRRVAELEPSEDDIPF